MEIIINMIFIAIMEAMLFSSTDFQTKLHLSSREPPRSGETRIERPWSTLSGLLGKLPILAGLPTVLFATAAMAATPNYVQGNYAVPQTPQTKVTVTYTTSQTAGDLSVVIVGWNDSTAQVSSLTDSKGNIYQLAVGTTVLTGSAPLSQAIYYAKNISAATPGANAVTLTFNTAATNPDIRILEYSGIDPVSPVDVVVDATGNSATTNSGAVITKNANGSVGGSQHLKLADDRPRQRIYAASAYPARRRHRRRSCGDSSRFLQRQRAAHQCGPMDNANGGFPRGGFCCTDA